MLSIINKKKQKVYKNTKKKQSILISCHSRDEMLRGVMTKDIKFAGLGKRIHPSHWL